MAEQSSAIPYDLLMSIQNGAMAFRYRGCETFKNPFDLALYTLLLADLRPATIVEIGSHAGGSALWFADTAEALGIAAHVHSLDVIDAERPKDERISFHVGDAHRLGDTFGEPLLRALPRPWLVVEDSDHQRQTALAVLRFFDPWLAAGDYVVVEDGILTDMRVGPAYDGGPLAAIHQFLAEAPGRYEIDRAYCDHFGRNVTWNVDGWLRRNAG